MSSSKIASSSSLSSISEKSQKSQKKPEHLAEVLNVSCNEDILEFIQQYIDTQKLEEPSQKFCKSLKKELDKKFGKEWNIFVGGHFCGAVGAVSDGYVELLINGMYKIVAFKTFSG